MNVIPLTSPPVNWEGLREFTKNIGVTSKLDGTISGLVSKLAQMVSDTRDEKLTLLMFPKILAHINQSFLVYGGSEDMRYWLLEHTDLLILNRDDIFLITGSLMVWRNYIPSLVNSELKIIKVLGVKIYQNLKHLGLDDLLIDYRLIRKDDVILLVEKHARRNQNSDR